MGRTHVRIKGQNLNFYLEIHATTHHFYFTRLRILPRNLVHNTGVWMTLKLWRTVFGLFRLHSQGRSYCALITNSVVLLCSLTACMPIAYSKNGGQKPQIYKIHRLGNWSADLLFWIKDRFVDLVESINGLKWKKHTIKVNEIIIIISRAHPNRLSCD